MAGAVQAAAHLCCSSFQDGIAPLELQRVQVSLARTRVKLAALSLSGRMMGPMLWLLLMQLQKLRQMLQPWRHQLLPERHGTPQKQGV